MNNGDNILFEKGEDDIIKFYKKNKTIITSRVFTLQEVLEMQDGYIKRIIDYAKSLFDQVLANK